MQTSDSLPSASREYSLDFIKILATCAIVIHHYQQETGAYFQNFINFWGDWFPWGLIVELFFILSGYFMARYVEKLSKEEVTLSHWMLSRGSRLLPMVCLSAIAYEAVLFLYVRLVGESWKGTEISIFGTLLTSLGIQHGWGFADPYVNYATWYISVLMACYLFFYLTTALARRIKCSPVYLYIFMIFLGASTGLYKINIPLINPFTARGYYSFFTGLLLGLYIQYRGISRKMTLASMGIIAGYAFLAATRPWYLKQDLVFILTFLLYPSIVIFFESAWIRKLFTHKFWGTLSSISFNVYLWHCILIILMYIGIRRFSWQIPVSNLGVMFLFLLTSWILGAVVHYCAELPIQKRLRQKFH